MLIGITGSLVSGDYAARFLPGQFAGRLGEDSRRQAATRLTRWWRGVASMCGPSSSVRALVDAAAVPLATALGLEATRSDSLSPEVWRATLVREGLTLPMIIIPWQASSDGAWRQAARDGLLHRTSWCLVYNGTHLRLLDTLHTHARRHLDFEFPLVLEHDDAFALFWALLRPDALCQSSGNDESLVARIVRASDDAGVRVCSALRTGVLTAIEQILSALFSDAVRRRQDAPLEDLHDQALTAVYRMLFLLFAEAHTLVPAWHPVYRDAYSIEALRAIAESRGPTAGLWETFQAIGRLAHNGCRAGELVVTAFNGRLFSPARAPRLETASLGDESVRRAMVAVSTSITATGRPHRVAFRDLGVEELGGVYETLLEYEPRVDSVPEPAAPNRAPKKQTRVTLARSGGGLRKATGTFYTPRTLTQFLVRQALQPLTAGVSSAAVLELRVCDPAMGSGAFLVAACRFLAAEYERALVAEGSCTAADLDQHDRAGFRRLVAQRCLFGADLNPMAVQLARLSLWLTTLAADSPLTFLDHHLVVGDSLVGAGPADLLRHPPGVARRRQDDERQLVLFDPSELESLIGSVLPLRITLEREADTTAAAVREKERVLELLRGRKDAARWRAACDIWCADSCAPRAAPGPTLRALLDHALHETDPGDAVSTHVRATRQRAERLHCLHWPLEFPEVFFNEDGRPARDAGFHAVVGNPPWEMLRADGESGSCRNANTMRFARRSGIYPARTRGHVNQYQLFVERAVGLVRNGGRLGLIVPSGFATDTGTAELRARMLRECDLDALVGFENRWRVFPIHRSLKFLLLMATRGRPTARVRCQFGLTDPAVLDHLADEISRDPARALPISVTPAVLRRISGPDLAIPDFRCGEDLMLTERLAAMHRPLADPTGWGARFGRELNATDHRRHFTTVTGGLPVLEGKHVTPYHVDVASAALWVSSRTAVRLLGGNAAFNRPRLAYRDVSSATNRLTLIAAIVPKECVTTHTLFCLRTAMRLSDQRVLCALLNSYVANFLVRLRVSTHVTAAVLHTIPVPRPDPDSAIHTWIETRVSRRGHAPEGAAVCDAELQALAACAYGLTLAEYEHVLRTFPLVPAVDRERALEDFKQRTPAGYSRSAAPEQPR
jgi:hypothetical protein